MGQKASRPKRGGTGAKRNGAGTKRGGAGAGGGAEPAAGYGTKTASNENPDGEGDTFAPLGVPSAPFAALGGLPGEGEVVAERIPSPDGQGIRETTEARFRQATGIVQDLANPNPDPDSSTATLTMTLPQNTSASSKVSEFIGNYLRREGSPLVKDELIAVAVALDPELRIADVATMTLPELRRLIRSTLITHHIARARQEYGYRPDSTTSLASPSASKIQNP